MLCLCRVLQIGQVFYISGNRNSGTAMKVDQVYQLELKVVVVGFFFFFYIIFFNIMVCILPSFKIKQLPSNNRSVYVGTIGLYLALNMLWSKG